MKTIWTILVIVLVIVGAALVVRGINKAPGETLGPGMALPYQEGLPTVVEAKRQAIAGAESYEALAGLATEKDFSYSFGGPYEGGFAAYIKTKAENTGINYLERLDSLLSLPYSKSYGIYVWPGVFEKEAKDWTAADIAIMKTISTDEEIEQYRKFGAYIGYRIGIREDGEWIFFIAGD